MSKKIKNVLILSILLAIVFLVGCNSNVNPVATGLSTQEAKLIGAWHAMPNVTEDYAEIFSFYENGSYEYLPNSSVQDDDFGVGKWNVKGTELHLTQEQLNGNGVNTQIILAIGDVENAEENEAYPYKIKINNKYYWKISDNPEFVVRKIVEPTNNTDKDEDSVFDLGSTTGNINNGGFFAATDKWVFYQNTSDGNKLYKMDINGEASKVSDDIAEQINIVGEEVYYINKDLCNLFKVNVDGGSVTMLSDDRVYNIRVAGNWVYYLKEFDKYSLYRMSIDGKNETKLFDGTVRCYDISDDWIYLTNIISTDKAEMIKIKLDGSEREKISDSIANDLQVAKEWIIYSNPADKDKIYKINIDGTQETKLCDHSSTRINVYKDYVYFIDSVYFKINRMKLDGSNMAVINEVESENLHVLYDCIYFDEDISNGNSPGNPQFSHYRMNLDGSGKVEF